MFDASNLCRSLPNYSINAARRRAAVAHGGRRRVAQLLSIQSTRAGAVAGRKAGGTGRMRGPPRPARPPRQRRRISTAVPVPRTTTVSMEEIRPSSVAWRAEMTRCSYAAYVLITQVSPPPSHRRRWRGTVQYRSAAAAAAASVLTQYELLRLHVSITPISSPPLLSPSPSLSFPFWCLAVSRIQSQERRRQISAGRRIRMGPAGPFFDSAAVLSRRPTLRPLSRAAARAPCPIRRSVLDDRRPIAKSIFVACRL